MPVLPFHRYIGPGNKSDNGEPVDEDDRIAKQHDLRYDRAKSEEDVRRADLEAIIQFRRNWLEGNWHSLIGDVGLSLKYVVESFTGVIYPDLPVIYINENDECRIIVINNILKLHCVFKRKPFLEKCKVNPFISEEDKIHLPRVFKVHLINDAEFSDLLPKFVYVPLNWPEIYIRSQSNYILLTNFRKEIYRTLSIKNVSKDSLKIITKYLKWNIFTDNIFINKTKDDKLEENGRSDRDVISLIYSGCVYFDQDGHLHLENLQ